MAAGWPDWTSLQFLKPLVFQASDLPVLPFDVRATPAVDAAEQLLRRALSSGPRHYSELLSEGAEVGLSRSTMHRSRRRMSVTSAGGVWSLASRQALG